MRRADIVTASVLVALGVLALLVIIPRYVAGGASADDLPPAFMPYVATALGTVAMALLLAARLPRPAEGDDAAPLPRQSWRFIGLAAAVLGAAFVLMARFGYLPGAAVIVAGFMALARARPAVIAGAAIAFPVTLWLLLDRVLGFPLP